MTKAVKMLLCSGDDGLMLEIIKNRIAKEGLESDIVLVQDSSDAGTIAREIVDADVVYPDKAVITGSDDSECKKGKIISVRDRI
ncbi:MAG: hypothetical protein MRK02_04205 [Candidatus Scalindua sp.]|nr:hypothetical protein [Candidatus Scalindua sp.]